MRKSVSVLAAVVVAVLALSCGGGAKQLYLYNWTYYIPEDVVKDFTKETGIKVIEDSYASNEEMYSKLVAGG
ncbi:MAG: spermidine/putrescine ABC transporter substrate-binding protein, partial [Spirochaetia bacterium]|nr:spermidine/putrescine ABC transporter substrate-binding protein [Spirochaetia bacterium]